jgi:hypothetical protein
MNASFDMSTASGLTSVKSNARRLLATGTSHRPIAALALSAIHQTRSSRVDAVVANAKNHLVTVYDEATMRGDDDVSQLVVEAIQNLDGELQAKDEELAHKDELLHKAHLLSGMDPEASKSLIALCQNLSDSFIFRKIGSEGFVIPQNESHISLC